MIPLYDFTKRLKTSIPDNGQIWPRLNERHTLSLLKPQRGAPNVVVGVITGHGIMGTHARYIGLGHLANDFRRSCRFDFVCWVHVKGERNTWVLTT